MLNAKALLDGFADPPASYRPQPFGTLLDGFRQYKVAGE